MSDRAVRKNKINALFFPVIRVYFRCLRLAGGIVYAINNAYRFVALGFVDVI